MKFAQPKAQNYMIPPSDRISASDYYQLTFKGHFFSPEKMERNLIRIRNNYNQIGDPMKDKNETPVHPK